MKIFNVLLHLEEYDEETGLGEDVILPDKLSSHVTLDGARDWAGTVVKFLNPYTYETSDLNPNAYGGQSWRNGNTSAKSQARKATRGSSPKPRTARGAARVRSGNSKERSATTSRT